MSVRRLVWDEQAMNTDKAEVVADPVFPPSLQSGSLPSSGSIFARPQSSRGCRGFPHSWLLRPGGEDL